MIYSKYSGEFRKLFGVPLERFNDALMMMATREFELDVFKLEDFLVQNGYVKDSEQSMKQFIEEKFGKKASDLVSEILKPKRRNKDEHSNKGAVQS